MEIHPHFKAKSTVCNGCLLSVFHSEVNCIVYGQKNIQQIPWLKNEVSKDKYSSVGVVYYLQQHLNYTALNFLDSWSYSQLSDVITYLHFNHQRLRFWWLPNKSIEFCPYINSQGWRIFCRLLIFIPEVFIHSYKEGTFSVNVLD